MRRRIAGQMWAAVGALLVLASPACAGELEAMVSIAMRGAVAELAAAFEKETGHKIKATVAAPGEIVAKIRGGQHADIVVLTTRALAGLEDKGLVRRGTRVAMASTGFGIAVRSADPAPDISTPEALRAALVSADRVIYNDPKVTPSGAHFLRVAERLGVADQVKAKSVVVAAGANIAALTADTNPGKVLAVSVIVEVRGHPGAKLVGPLPGDLQSPLPYAAVLGAHPVDVEAAEAFLKWLGSAEAKRAYAAAGFDVAP